MTLQDNMSLNTVDKCSNASQLIDPSINFFIKDNLI